MRFSQEGRCARWLAAVLLLAWWLPAPALGFKPEFHEPLNDNALSASLTKDVLCRINESDKAQDGDVLALSPGRDVLHFNDCDFTGTAAFLNERYRRLLHGLRPDATREEALEAAETFGALLHTVQDFYAHSNWVEQGYRELVDVGVQWWPELKGPDLERKFVFLQRGTPTAEDATLHPGGQVTVRYGNEELKGIITGAVGGRSTSCPAPVSLGHWDWCRIGGGLNKDSPRRAGHCTAMDLATSQTRHELCRLGHLLTRKYGASEGLRTLQRYWLTSTASLEQLCTQAPAPAPACADCAPTTTSEHLDTYFNKRLYAALRVGVGVKSSVVNATLHGRVRLLERLTLGIFGGIEPEGLLTGLRVGGLGEVFFLEAGLRYAWMRPTEPRLSYVLSAGYEFRPTGPLLFHTLEPSLELGLRTLLRRVHSIEGCTLAIHAGDLEGCFVPELSFALTL